MVSFATAKRTLEQIYAEFSAKNVTFMAAGIAYNAFISLAPLLVVLLLVVSTIGGGLEDRLLTVAEQSLPGPIAGVFQQVFEGNGGTSGASVVGLVVLIWGTLKIFRGLDTAFSEIYETTDVNSFVDKLIDGVVVGVAIVVAIVATVGVTAAFARFEDTIPFVGLLTPLVLVGGLVVAFLPMYYRFPDTDVSVRDVLPGVVFAAVGWAAFQAVFQVYLTFSGGDSGSVFGGVIVVITWLYFSGLVLLVGAVINSVIGGHTSGEAGGVGQGATGYETEEETTMDRAEFIEFLQGLQADLTDRYTDPGATDGGVRERPQPVDEITVIEQSSDDDEAGEKWAVSFRWKAADDDGDPRVGSSDD
jgi:membrane protein